MQLETKKCSGSGGCIQLVQFGNYKKIEYKYVYNNPVVLQATYSGTMCDVFLTLPVKLQRPR